MQEKTSKIAENSAKVGLHLNVAKTKVMKLNAKSNNPIKVGNEDIEEVCSKALIVPYTGNASFHSYAIEFMHK